MRAGSRPTLGAVRFANAVGTAAAATSRVLGVVEHRVSVALAVVLFALAGVAAMWPVAVGYPLAVIAAWLGVVQLIRVRRILKHRRNDAMATANETPDRLPG